MVLKIKIFYIIQIIKSSPKDKKFFRFNENYCVIITLIKLYCNVTKIRDITMPNKEQINSDPKPKKGTITLAIENNPCGRCRVAGFPTCKCGGGGGAGSGSGGGSSGDKTKNTDTMPASNQAIRGQRTLAAIQEFDKAKTIFVQSLLASNTTTNFEAGLLLIESDPLYGNLTLKIKPGLSKSEIQLVQDFFKIIKKEFESFKDQLTEKGISTTNFTIEVKDDKLSIHIPNPKYYRSFIEKNNLFPAPNPEQNKNEIVNESKKEEKNKISPFSDISKGPKPNGIK